MNATDDDVIAICSAAGLTALFSRIGAKLLRLDVPLGTGRSVNIAMCAAADPGDEGADTWGGSVCGRYANRIAGAGFDLDGTHHDLPANNGANTLHGGPAGFGLRPWSAESRADGVSFRLASEDGDMGFPGRLDVAATYGIADDRLWLDMQAVTDRPTVVNLTQHAYWNLLGGGSVLDHLLVVPASRYTPVDEALIPLGPCEPVAGSRFDFTVPRPIGGSYDHNFCLDAGRAPLHLGAALSEAASGRRLEVWTTEPGLQVYTGDHFGAAHHSPYSECRKNGAVALEPQAFPDSPHQPDYPPVVLRPGEVYRHRIEWRLSGF